MDLPLNALRAFEVSARHLSFTRAGLELHLTQTAVSQHVKNLEDRLGKKLFRRIPRGLALTDEGAALLPVLTDAFERIGSTLENFKTPHKKEVLSVGVVGTFAVGWLLPRLRDFQVKHPFIDLRLFSNNNRVDLAGDGLDFAIRFGDGHWHGTEASKLFSAPLTPVCAPFIASRIHTPSDLVRATLDSYVTLNADNTYDTKQAQMIMPYIGCISSATKAKRFTDRLLQRGYDQQLVDQITMPIGLELGGKEPMAVAVSIAAQILQQYHKP